MTGLTTHPQKAMFQATAFEEVFELPQDIHRRFRALLGHDIVIARREMESCCHLAHSGPLLVACDPPHCACAGIK